MYLHTYDEPAAETSSGYRSTLLVVTEDEETREWFSHVLNEAGKRVVAVTTPTEASKIASKINIDLALVDGSLRNGDAFDLCSDLRRLAPSTPVVFYSHKATKDDVRKGIESGAAEYFTKPLSRSLANSILQIIN